MGQVTPPVRTTVLRMLDAGWTVSRIMDATTWPRRQIEAVAAAAGMLRRPSLDTWVATRSAPRPSGALEQLLAAGDGSGRQRTRALSARIRHLVQLLEVDVAREQSAVARDGYNATHVRRWAREAGLNPPTAGRFLPQQIVAAWEQAGRP